MQQRKRAWAESFKIKMVELVHRAGREEREEAIRQTRFEQL